MQISKHHLRAKNGRCGAKDKGGEKEKKKYRVIGTGPPALYPGIEPPVLRVKQNPFAQKGDLCKKAKSPQPLPGTVGFSADESPEPIWPKNRAFTIDGRNRPIRPTRPPWGDFWGAGVNAIF